ncbi:MAG: hypothetical protein AAF206_13135, partial [Bacteroidota bacterium]
MKKVSVLLLAACLSVLSISTGCEEGECIALEVLDLVLEKVGKPSLEELGPFGAATYEFISVVVNDIKDESCEDNSSKVALSIPETTYLQTLSYRASSNEDFQVVFDTALVVEGRPELVAYEFEYTMEYEFLMNGEYQLEAVVDANKQMEERKED